MAKKVIVLDVVGLSGKHFLDPRNLPHMASLLDRGHLTHIAPCFPATTLPAQATMTTGTPPAEHGVVANGFYFPENFQISFWEQAAGLVQTERIWDRLKRKNPALTTALLFMQNSLYGHAETIITPKPMHTDAGMVQWCYSKPVGFYEQIRETLGEFELKHYWGPLASIESSRWIAGAARETLAKMRPDLMFVYLPHLDYCTQKFGPESQVVMEELLKVDQEVGSIIEAVDTLGLREETVFIVLSEYAFYPVNGAVAINRILRANNLLAVRAINGREYLDLELSPAFAMVDHQAAHIYIKPGFKEAVLTTLRAIPEIDLLLASNEEKEQYGILHQRCGDIVAVSAKDKWFSYYWWEDMEKAPDFADHIDIHRKPGYDPLELFFDPKTFKIPQDTSLVKGSHGYPPAGPDDHVPLLISGPGSADIVQHLPKLTEMRDVAGLIEALLLATPH
jgi:predicted AlkP superfamily pyrophosphatase or phosphodiesterase